MFSEKIFKAYDIRGEFGKDFDKEFAKKLGNVLANHLRAKKIVVARDARPSSTEISQAVIAGVTSFGADVVDVGVVSTPLFYFGALNEKADGGVMITASHLGDEFNGFKVTKESAISIRGSQFFDETRELFV